MVEVHFDPAFRKAIEKINEAATKERVKKQIRKIVENPNVGKLMGYARKNTREIYVSPYRLSYALVNDRIIFLELYHKDQQ